MRLFASYASSHLPAQLGIAVAITAPFAAGAVAHVKFGASEPTSLIVGVAIGCAIAGGAMIWQSRAKLGLSFYLALALFIFLVVGGATGLLSSISALAILFTATTAALLLDLWAVRRARLDSHLMRLITLPSRWQRLQVGPLLVMLVTATGIVFGFHINAIRDLPSKDIPVTARHEKSSAPEESGGSGPEKMTIDLDGGLVGPSLPTDTPPAPSLPQTDTPPAPLTPTSP